MKKFLAVLALVSVSTSALADGYHGRPYPGYRPPVIHEYRSYHSSTGDVLMPLILGGVVGYAIGNDGRQQQQQPVIIQQPQVIQQPRINPNEPVYQYQTIHDMECDCDRRVLVKIN